MDALYRVRTTGGVTALSPAGGHCLPHEHIVLDLRVWWEGADAWNALDEPGIDAVPELATDVARAPQAVTRENLVLADWYLAAKELRAARQAGCQLLTDLTVHGLDPQQHLAAKAAALAGLQLVLGVGRYLEPTFGEAERAASVEELTDRWCAQAEEGFSGLLPGVIGEIGTSPELADAEVVSLRAAAQTQQRTGLPVNVHVHPYARRALDVLRLLDTAGADLSRVAISHCDGEIDVGWLLGLLRSGCYVEFDQLGTGPWRLIEGRGYPTDAERIAAIAALAEAGYADRILVSHDICMRSSLLRYGGHGYAHLGRTFAPQLAKAVSDEAAYLITCVNPLAFLSVA